MAIDGLLCNENVFERSIFYKMIQSIANSQKILFCCSQFNLRFYRTVLHNNKQEIPVL